MKNWAEISKQRLAANFRLLARAAGPQTSVMAVVKANAYGHGADLCSPVLAAAGAGWLGVTDASEGEAVRSALTRSGLSEAQQPRILVMSEPLDEDAKPMVEHGLTPILSSVEQLKAFSRATTSVAKPFPVHLEIDTGMARQGVSVGAALDEVLRWVSGQNLVCLEGVMTHFAAAEVAGSHQTAKQRSQFEGAIEQVAASGLRPAWVHAGNSSTLDNPVEADAGPSSSPLSWLEDLAHRVGARAMVRSGLALYGYALSVEREQGYAGCDTPQLGPHLQTVMTWKARVTGLREIEAGSRIGYNGTFVADRPMRLALLPVGYADGLRRELSGTNHRTGGWVLLHGQLAAIVGRVSMNLTIVDATAIPSVAIGDEAVLLGEGITADDHARIAGTVPYEILCGVKAEPVLR